MLNSNGRGDCSGRGLEHGEHRVARHVDYAAMVRLDLGTKYRARRIERGHGRAVVDRHQARIARRIRGEDRCQALLETRPVHTRGTLCKLPMNVTLRAAASFRWGWEIAQIRNCLAAIV